MAPRQPPPTLVETEVGRADGVSLLADGDGPVAVNPPWRLSPIQNIVNINFGEGLAVEFFDGET
jgi:hypothetical protein